MKNPAEEHIKTHEEFVRRSLALWVGGIKNIFPVAIPERACWTGLNEIVKVLDKMSAKDCNHLFFPSGGGLDLEGASVSHEPECLALDNDGPTIVRPLALHFESFGPTRLDWAYFRLEAATLTPSGVYEDLGSLDHEELTELTPLNYVDRSVMDAGYNGYDENGDEKELPAGARVVVRYFGGAFLIVAKGSDYNGDTSTYDARHNKMTAAEFRVYMERQSLHR